MLSVSWGKPEEILAGCTLFFVMDVDDKEFEFPSLKWKASELGAACTDVYLSVTHVVSVQQGQEQRVVGWRSPTTRFRCIHSGFMLLIICGADKAEDSFPLWTQLFFQ